MKPATHLLSHKLLTSPWASPLNKARQWAAPLLFALLSVFGLQTAAAQWVWKDGRGVTNYSDVAPPLSVPEKMILKRPGDRLGEPSAAAGAPAAAASGVLGPRASASGPQLKPARQDTELEKRKKEKDAADAQAVAEEANAQKAKEAADKFAACSANKSRIANLAAEGRVATVNANGEREILTDEQKAERLGKARAQQAENC